MSMLPDDEEGQPATETVDRTLDAQECHVETRTGASTVESRPTIDPLQASIRALPAA